MPSQDMSVVEEQLTDLISPEPSSYDLTGPLSNVLSPLGTLSILPRELRDEVFKAVMIIVNGRIRFSHRPPPPKMLLKGASLSKWGGSHFGLLRASKAIRQEALYTLCNSAFFSIRFNARPKDYYYRRNDIPFLDRISKIEFAFNLSIFSDADMLDLYEDREEENRKFALKSAGPLTLFTGTEVLRNTCIITLSSCTPKFPLLFKSPLLHAISRLAGFKTVKLDFYFERFWFSGSPQSKTTYDYTPLIVRISNALEPSLGPYSIDMPVEKIAFAHVTFHPQDYLTERSLVEESSNLDEEATPALSTISCDYDTQVHYCGDDCCISELNHVQRDITLRIMGDYTS